MTDENRINDTDNNNEVQGNDSEIKTDIQETGDGREEVEIVSEEKEETKEDNSSSLEQMKKVLMSYIDKIVDEKINVVRETEIKEEIEEKEPEEETLFNSFKEF